MSSRLRTFVDTKYEVKGNTMADQNTSDINLHQLLELITQRAYIAGFGFAIAAILKFKAHKDNPGNIDWANVEAVARAWWSSIPDSKLTELESRGVSFQSAVDALNGDPSQVVSFIESLKSSGVS